MNAYGRDFEETKYMSVLIKDKVFLEKYDDIWDKVNEIIKEVLIVSLYKMFLKWVKTIFSKCF